METTTSLDGTLIAFERSGEGPPLILVGGAFSDRRSAAPTAAALCAAFTVHVYDRRGRGASGDTAPYAVERELEDLDALIAAAGGRAAVYGHSSGGVLGLRAAARGAAITRVAAYEPPIIVDDTRPRPPADLGSQLAALVGLGRRGDAVELFLAVGVGLSAETLAQMRRAPMWPGLEALAHTLCYDVAITADDAFLDRLPQIAVPALVLDGGASPAWARNAVETLARAIPGGRRETLAGQTHAADPAALAPVLTAFFAA